MSDKIKKAQEELDKLPVLFLEGYKENWSFQNWSLEDFILQFITSLSESNRTLIVKNGEVESKPAKRRSIGDIYRIAKYYYDEVTLLEIQYILAKMWKDKKVGYFYCNSSKKRMYMTYDYYKGHSVNPVEYPSPDEYDIKPAEISKLASSTWEQL